MNSQNILDIVGNVENQEILNRSVTLNPIEGLKILLLALLAGFFIRYIYKKYSTTFSSREGYGNTIVLIILSVASLIAVVKSSLSLSLGLVGALSVVRFRTAVKEPINLAFLLLAICIGIGIGASQFIFSFLTLFLGSATIYFLFKNSGSYINKNSQKTISENIENILITINQDFDINDIYKILNNNTFFYELQSLEQSQDNSTNLNIKIRVKSPSSIERIRKDLKSNFNTSSFIFYNSPDI